MKVKSSIIEVTNFNVVKGGEKKQSDTTYKNKKMEEEKEEPKDGKKEKKEKKEVQSQLYIFFNILPKYNRNYALLTDFLQQIYNFHFKFIFISMFNYKLLFFTKQF